MVNDQEDGQERDGETTLNDFCLYIIMQNSLYPYSN